MSDFRYYLAVGTMSGEAPDPAHSGALAVDDYSVTVTQSGTAAAPVGNGAGSPGVSSFGGLSISVSSQTALAKLLSLIASGTHVAGATLTARTNTVTPVDAYALDLGDVSVTSVVGFATGGYEIALAHTRFELTVPTQTAGGNTTPGSTFGWDTSTAAPTTADVPTTTPAGSVPGTAPVRYFLLVDGFDGASGDAAHLRWFDVSDFFFDLANFTAQGGTREFNPLTVSFDQDSALTDFLTKVSNGRHIKGLRLEGVDGNGAAVYDLTLSDLVVKTVGDGSNAGFSTSFDYAKIELVTRGQRQDGSYVSTGAFGYNRTTSAAYTPGATLPPLAAGNAPGEGVRGSGSLAYYLVLDGIKGDAPEITLSDPPSLPAGALAITDYSFDVSQAGSALSTTFGKSTFSHLNVTVSNQTALADLLLKVSSGSNIAKGSLLGFATDGQPQKVYELDFRDIQLTDVTALATGGYLVSFDYRGIGLTTRGQTTSGQYVASGTFSWNVASGNPGPMPEAATPTSAVAATVASKYYLLVPGFNGGSTAPGHAGWFELDDFSVQLSQKGTAQSGGGLGAGKAEFGPLSVSLKTDTALVRLLNSAATGTQISAIRVEGVTDGSQPVAVYDLTLSNVLVKDVSDQSGTGYSVQFAFRKFELIEKGQKNDGSYVTTSAAGWDLKTNGPVDVTGLTALTPGSANPYPVTSGNLRYFLNVGTVNGGTFAAFAGDSNVASHKGALLVSSYDIDVSRTDNGTTSTPQFGQLSVTVTSDAGLSAFLAAFARGSTLGLTLFASAVNVSDPRARSYDAYTLDLNNAHVTAIRALASGGYDVTLDYGVIALTTRAEKPDGTNVVAGKFGWNVTTGTATTDVTSYTDATVPLPSVTPDRYFLYVEGVNGGSTEQNHRGWFEVSGISFGAQRAGSSGAAYSPLEVSFGDPTGLPALLRAAATGNHLRMVRLEGVSTSGNSVLTPVYDLTLTDVVAQNLDVAGGTDHSVAFDYAGLELSTRGQVNDGSYQVTSRIGLDRTTGTVSSPAGITLVSLTENEVGNGSPNQSGTQANQTGGAAVKIQSLRAGNSPEGLVTSTTDESIAFSAPVGDLLRVQNIPSGNLFPFVGSIQLGGTGSDSLTATDARGAYLNGGQGEDTLRGWTGADILYGGLGNDSLNGGAGADLMDGGEGADTYYADALDSVVDTGTTGIDTLYASANWTLGETSGIENLAAGAALVNGTLTGNSLANRITGNGTSETLLGLGGDDVILGNGGDDILVGGAGRDVLSGGGGTADVDTFRFAGSDSVATSTGFDSITDFNVADRIDLDTISGSLNPIRYGETTTSAAGFAGAFSAAQSQMAGGTLSVVFVAGPTDGYLFWDNDANYMTAEGAVRLNGLNNVSMFDRTNVI